MITARDRWRHAPGFAVRNAALFAQPGERCGIRTHAVKPCAHRREFAFDNFLIACGYKDVIESGILPRVHLLSPHPEPGTAFYRTALTRHQACPPGATHGAGRSQFTRENEGFNKRTHPEQIAALKQDDGDAAYLWLAAPMNPCSSFPAAVPGGGRAHLFIQAFDGFQVSMPSLRKPGRQKTK